MLIHGTRRAPAITVDGIAIDLITPDDDEQSLARAWEEEADRWAKFGPKISGMIPPSIWLFFNGTFCVR